MKKNRIFLLAITFLLLTVAGAYAGGDDPPEPAPAPVDPQIFDCYVSIGDSLTHGFQSGAVDETRQPTTYPNLIAAKMGTEFNQPLLKFPGYLINIEDVLKGNIAWYEYYYPLVGGERVDGAEMKAVSSSWCSAKTALPRSTRRWIGTPHLSASGCATMTYSVPP